MPGRHPASPLPWQRTGGWGRRGGDGAVRARLPSVHDNAQCGEVWMEGRDAIKALEFRGGSKAPLPPY